MAKRKSVSSHQIGKWGEERAAVFLRLKGYRILERNYRVPQGEIDLIALKNGVVVFVEVKSRKGRAQGTPLEAVSPHKVRRLSAAAALYLAQRPGPSTSCRFDVVTLGPEKNWMGLGKLRHFENAFAAEGFFNI
jgi:putative endonuclease